VGDALESYRNLEKLRGVPAERLLTLPDPTTADEAAWGQVFDKLGRPKSAEEYGLEVPEGQDASFAKAMSAHLHKLGLTKQQGQELAKAWNAEQSAIGQRMLEEQKAAATADKEALAREWGAAHEKNLSVAQAAAKKFGADEALIGAMQEQIGYAKTLKFFQQIGAAMGESDFVDGKGQGLGVMTPEQAKAEIAQLKSDTAWVDRYIEGGKAEKDRMEALIRWANA
jgi:hypothetical protein